MDLRIIPLAILVIFFRSSECQRQQQFCQSGSMQASSGSSILLRTSESTNSYDYSNDIGDCGCQLRVEGDMDAVLQVSSRLTKPAQEGNSNNEDKCGPYVMMSRMMGQSSVVMLHQCPRPPTANDSSNFVFDFSAGGIISLALVNQERDDIKGAFTVTLLRGMVTLTCGLSVQAAPECPCIHHTYAGGPKTGDTKLADRFVAAIVAVVIFLVLCGVAFCIYMILKKRKAKQDTEGGPTPEKNNIDGSENKAYAGSLKSLDKSQKPDKLPRTLNSPDKTSPEKEDAANTSYIRYHSNDALNLSLQQPAGTKTPTGISSIIGTADVRGSTESGIYSSADLIGPDQMYGPNGTPQRPKPGLPPRTPSKEEIEAMYAQPNKPRPPPGDYYSNVPEQSPYAHQPAALPGGPPRSMSQDRLDGRRAASFERLDATPMTHRTPSRDRLDTSRDNAAYMPEQPHYGSKHSLSHSQTDV